MTSAIETRPSGLTDTQGVLLVLLAGALWSIMGLGIRLMQEAIVWQILVYRSLSMIPILLALISWRSGGKPTHAIKAAGLSGVIGGLCLVAAFAGGIFAIQQTTVANAMFLFATAPFFAAVLGWLLLKETVRRATWFAMFFAAIGVAIMVSEGLALGYLVGNLAAIFSALGFACFTVALRWGKSEDMLPAVLWSGIFALIIALIMCAASGLPLAVPVNDALIGLGLGAFQLGAGLAVYTVGSRVVPAAELALLSMTEVVLAPLWVWLALGETAGPYTMIGGAVLLAAIAGNALSGLRRRPKPLALR